MTIRTLFRTSATMIPRLRFSTPERQYPTVSNLKWPKLIPTKKQSVALITWIKGLKDSIRFLKVNSHDRHWILKNEDHIPGFHPLTGRNEKIVNNSLQSESDISRLVCVHPESKWLNVPLSICSLIQNADKTGVSDQNLLQMILMFLKKHCPQTYFAVNPKKGNLRSLISALTLYCNCEDQITLISLELSKFARHQGKLFSECISKFDSLFTIFANASPANHKRPIKHSI